MILLQKRRVLLIITCVFISIFTYYVLAPSKENLIETVSLPVTNKVVILDAGHGGEDERC